MLPDINKFISEKITGRPTSYFATDLQQNKKALDQAIGGSKVLVIGGAGTIGSSFIKALVRYNPETLVVVDINENGLTELTRDLRSTKDITVPKNYLTYPVNFSSPVFKKLLAHYAPF